MDKSMYGKMSDDRRTKESPTCGLANRPTKEGFMSENEIKILEIINRTNNKNMAIKATIDLLVSLLTDPQKSPANLQEAS